MPSETRVKSFEIGGRRVVCRVTGDGPPLLLVHGWPFHAASYRQIVPLLAGRVRCYAMNLPGSGDSEWGPDTDFGFPAQGRMLSELVSALGLDRVHVMGHDSGGSIARLFAAADSRVASLVLLNTEMPRHRPPWIRFFQATSRLPGSLMSFRMLLRSPTFLRSSMSFGGCFYDRSLVNDEFTRIYIKPLLEDERLLLATQHRLRAIDFRLLDGLDATHAAIKAPTLVVWGEDDPTFPVALARDMSRTFPTLAGFHAVPKAKLLVHEERPEEVARLVLDFFAERKFI